MADASTQTPISGLSGDPLFHALYLSHNKVVEVDLPAFRTILQNRILAGSPAIVDAGNQGSLKIGATFSYGVGVIPYKKGITDNFWALTANGTLGLTTWQAVALYIDAAGVASYYAGSTASDTATAMANLEAVPATKARVGIYLAMPEADYSVTLSGEGVIYDGSPFALFLSSYAVTLG